MGLLIFTKNKNVKIPHPFKELVRTKKKKKMTVTFMCLKNHIKLHLVFYYFQNTFKKSVRNNIFNFEIQQGKAKCKAVTRHLVLKFVYKLFRKSITNNV